MEDWKIRSEIFYNFAVGIGAIGGGFFAIVKAIIDWLVEKRKSSIKNEFKKLYPRKDLNITFQVVDTEKLPGKLYILDLKNKEKHWIQSSQTLLDLGLFWDDSRRISLDEFSKYKEGSAILTEGKPGS
jgi:hypothetical protein